MGSNQWRYFETFPSPDYQFYYLSTSGLASTRDDAGVLVETCPQDYQEDVFVHDPWRPVPALGGHASLPAGSFDRSHLDCRTDIITYTSTPLRQKLHLAGEVIVEIYCTADQPSYDLCAVLSQVTPEGKVYNLTQGYRRVDDSDRPLRLTLQATCVQIPEGHCLCLSLSGANFPAYPVNPGTGIKASEASSYEAQVITIRVSCGSEFSSQVLLPIEERY
jgi:putative CocE/NonD family hydrolase